jgi:proteasome lid subunit RPN8/RPN11
MQLSHETHNAFKEHVLRDFPNESCGLVIDGQYYPCKNASETPRKTFKIKGEERLSLELQHGPIQAVLHSHPYLPNDAQRFYADKYDPSWPSVFDQKNFIEDNCDWGIVSSDGDGISEIVWLSQKPVSLEKRPFAWFVSDCYAVVRDWYSLNTNIQLPNFTRPWTFWKNSLNTREDGIQAIPYSEKLPTEKAQVGDMVVFALAGSKVPNHLGVITGSNELLHVFANDKPGALYYAHTVRWDKWMSRARYVVRWKGLRFNEC